MGKNLFDFGGECIDEKMQEKLIKGEFTEEEAERKLKENNIDTEAIKASYDKYKNFSENDLMQEFIKTAQMHEKQGTLDKMYGLIEQLSPFISPEQKQFLLELMKKKDE